jgi:hypothetical protein
MDALARDRIAAGPRLNRIVATLICGHTGGLPDSSYPAYSTDIKLAFEAVDAFAAVHRNVKLTIEYPFPEVWVKRSAEQFSSGWVPAAYICEDALPHAICLALLKAAGAFEPGTGGKETA